MAAAVAEPQQQAPVPAHPLVREYTYTTTRVLKDGKNVAYSMTIRYVPKSNRQRKQLTPEQIADARQRIADGVSKKKNL